MVDILFFKEITKDDIEIAGGKGASLGEMYRHEFPVPNGFVITAQAYKSFVKHENHRIMKILDNLDVEDTEALDKASAEIHKIILAIPYNDELEMEITECYSELDGFVAVRSSATAEDLPEASFAGQQATYLNIKGRLELLDAVKKCFASLFTSRAIYYRVSHKFKHNDVLIAVVVQKMVDSEKAGVMFTANPVTNDKSEMIIEGAFGLGESVVSGELTPDSYIVNKASLEIKNSNIGTQTWGYFRDKQTGHTVKNDIDGTASVLSDKEVQELAEYGVKLEKHYGKLQDIEWGIADKVYILQSRPITTIK